MRWVGFWFIGVVVATFALSRGAFAQDAAVQATSEPARLIDASLVMDASPDVLPDGGGIAPMDSGGFDADRDGGKVWASCIEHLPEGITRPKLTNEFPSRGLAGHALTLRVKVEHGLGEKVLPNGFHVQRDSDAARALESAGFVLPDPQGPSGPSLVREQVDGRAVTDIQIHFVVLPDKPGRHELLLPPVPIAISRASGEFFTLCTTPHAVVVDEPIANEVEASPQDNPAPRPQRETWTLARDLTYGGLLGALAAALLAWLILWWKRRPKPPVPPPPPRPPWEVALESLEGIRRADLVSQGLHSEHVDRVSDVVRVYLGARFGFDGIESTTDEVLQSLSKVQPPLGAFDEVRRLLQDSDLVKFAKWSPSDPDCEQLLVAATKIVESTQPAVFTTFFESQEAPLPDAIPGSGTTQESEVSNVSGVSDGTDGSEGSSQEGPR